MHDIPSSQAEAGEANGQAAEYGHEFTGEHDIPNSTLEMAGEAGEAGEVAFGEADEVALAAELLEVRSDQELDQFLGRLIKRAARGVSKFARSSVGRAIGGALKGVVKMGLPLAAGAVGTAFGGPLGGMIGRKLGSMAGNLLEVSPELGEMSAAEREFEVARRFVRIGGAATRAAIRHSTNLRGRRDAVRLVGRVTRTYGPIWASMVRDGVRRRGWGVGGRNRGGAITMGYGPRGYDALPGAPRAGRWYRRGRSVVIVIS
jgi:hypothetical protein